MTGQPLIVFRATGEVRRARQDEYYKDGYMIYKAGYLDLGGKKYPIYSRHEIEATPDVLRALGMEEE